MSRKSRRAAAKPSKAPRILITLLAVLTVLSLAAVGVLLYHADQIRQELTAAEAQRALAQTNADTASLQAADALAQMEAAQLSADDALALQNAAQAENAAGRMQEAGR